MLGDTGVAVNPDDKRYTSWIGKKVNLPLMNRKIPVIADGYVDVAFGTGALKITPAHDPNDFEIGKKHSLDLIKVIGEDGRMSEDAGPYQGLDRFDARQLVVDDLQKEGLLLKVEPYRHFVGHCYRCKKIVEPNLSLQWFVKVQPLAELAIDAVKEGETRIIPRSWEKTYFEWMYNIKEWCISRQIWWGHRIPAWYCKSCGEITVEMDDPAACSHCSNSQIEQDSDVLDTWFSSALWPFSTLGWPEQTRHLAVFYPTACLVTGFDILFFWVARMMMMGLKFMGKVPFKEVYIHALVRDVEGQKMSKSRGNVIDPLEVIEKYGTDSFRFTLAAMAAQGRDIRLSKERIEGYRHFVNKIWNAARFVLMNLEGYQEEPHDRNKMSMQNRWITSRLQRIIQGVTNSMEEYKFNETAHQLYQFIWHELCDWYLEMIKPVLYQKEHTTEQYTTQRCMVGVLKTALELLHPLMPFVTEEIWQRLPSTDGSITVTSFPQWNVREVDQEAERQMDIIIKTVTCIRNLRSEMNIPPSSKPHVDLVSQASEVRSVLTTYKDLIVHLAALKTLSVHGRFKQSQSAAVAIIDNIEAVLSLEGVINMAEEKQRLQREIEKVLKDLKFVTKKLSNEDFLYRAPHEIIAKEREKAKNLKEKEARLRININRLNEHYK
jgi:valyl-tRNA synthetase